MQSISIGESAIRLLGEVTHARQLPVVQRCCIRNGRLGIQIAWNTPPALHNPQVLPFRGHLRGKKTVNQQ
jgi:hypothetical protein